MKLTLGTRRIQMLFALAALGAFAGQAHAERKYGMAGCGLGSLIFKPSGNQSSAAISNGIGYSNLFGITSGTSNCVPASKEKAEMEQEKFFVANFASLSKEIAQGGGDTVVAFAGTLGCETGTSNDVAGQLHGSYNEIFAAPGAVAAFDVAKDSLRAAPGLASKCANL